MAAYAAAYFKRHAAKILKTNAEWRIANPEKWQQYNVRWRETNREKSRQCAGNWEKKNPAKARAKATRRRAAKQNAIPAWASQARIREMYDLANRKSRHGESWHVDHIVPLSSPLVCGLHCEANLQVIPAIANSVKGNRYWPDMPINP